MREKWSKMMSKLPYLGREHVHLAGLVFVGEALTVAFNHGGGHREVLAHDAVVAAGSVEIEGHERELKRAGPVKSDVCVL